MSLSGGGGFLIEGNLTYLVPEPATVLLVGLGGLFLRNRRRELK